MPNSDPHRSDGDRTTVIGIPLGYADNPPGVNLPYYVFEVFGFRSPSEGGEEDVEVITNEGCMFGRALTSAESQPSMPADPLALEAVSTNSYKERGIHSCGDVGCNSATSAWAFQAWA